MKIKIRVHTNKGITDIVSKIEQPFYIFHEDSGFLTKNIESIIMNHLSVNKLTLKDSTDIMNNVKSISIF